MWMDLIIGMGVNKRDNGALVCLLYNFNGFVVLELIYVVFSGVQTGHLTII